MSLSKCLGSFLLLFAFITVGCDSSVDKSLERPLPIKTSPVKNMEINVPVVKPAQADSVVEDTLKHYHQETKKTIETKYLKKSFNLHRKPFVA